MTGRFLRIALICTSIGIAVGCSSPAPKNESADKSVPDIQPDKVLSRIDDLQARPGWLHESRPFEIKDGVVTSLGSTTIPGDHRIEAAYKICDNAARAEIGKSIALKLDAVFQVADEGTAPGDQRVQNMSAEAMRLTTNALKVSNHYWERVLTTADSGERTTKFKVFCTVTMDESAYKKAIGDSIRKAEGKGSISADLAKKADAQLERIVADDEKKSAE